MFNASEREKPDEEGELRMVGENTSKRLYFWFGLFSFPGLVCSYLLKQKCFVSVAILVLVHGTVS